MSSLKAKGIDELIKKLENMQKAPDKVVDKALKAAAEIVKETEIATVKKLHNKYSEDIGYKEIKTFSVKRTKTGAKIIQTGIRGSQNKKRRAAKGRRSDHWSRIRGLWFNNFGFYNEKTGKYVAGSNWIGKSFEDCKDKAYEKMKEVVLRELDL